jgi:hypothetical protein
MRILFHLLAHVSSCPSLPLSHLSLSHLSLSHSLFATLPLSRTKYHLTDVVTGRIDFLLVRIKIKCMEVAVVRKETVGPRELLLPGSG